MKVLHLISSGGMYGAEAVILNLSAALSGRERNSSMLGVFSHDPLQIPELHQAALDLGVVSELIPCKGQLDLRAGARIRDLVARQKVDLIHAHGYKADIYAFLAYRSRSRPALLSTCHTWYDNDRAVRVYGALDRWVLRYFDEVVAVSTEVADRLRGAGVSTDNVHLIRNGIDVARFQQAARERKYALADGAPLRVGLVGRLAPEKGVDLFLRAVAQVAEHWPHAEFVVAGEGPERVALEALRLELGLKGRVELRGAQQDMPGFYASLDLLVSASRLEGLPIALLEGMASGLPVVATRVGAVPQVVIDNETGFLVKPESPEALAGAIRQLLGSPSLRERYGRASQKRVDKDFSAHRMMQQYTVLYEQALSRSTPLRSVAHQSGV